MSEATNDNRFAWVLASVFALVAAFLARPNPLAERSLADALMVLGFLWLGTGVIHYAVTPAPRRRGSDSFGAALVLVMAASFLMALLGGN